MGKYRPESWETMCLWLCFFQIIGAEIRPSGKSRAAARTEERGREKTSPDIFEKKNQPLAKKRCLVYPPLFLCHFHTHEKALFFSRRQQPTLMRALLPLAFWDAFFGGGGFGLQGGRDDHYSKAKTKRSRGKKILTTLSEKNIWG